LCTADAAVRGGNSGKLFTAPPSWSVTTRTPAGLDALRFHRPTITAPTPRGDGNPETTTIAAFCCGVRLNKVAQVMRAATPKASVD